MVTAEISRLTINNEGEVVQKKIDVQARKIPFHDIRNKTLPKIKDDSYYNQLTKDKPTAEHRKNTHEEHNIDQMRSKLSA